MTAPLVIAHRGASAAAPENTLAAFRLALDVGVDMIELDVRFTSDGEAVAIHDSRVERTTDGVGAVASLPLDTVRQLDAGAWFEAGFTGERVPTLRQVCRQVFPTKCDLLIEIKADKGLPPDFPTTLLDLLDQESMRSRSTLQSFDHWAVRQLRRADPRLQLALLHDSRERDVVASTLSAGAGIAALRWRHFGRAIREQAHSKGLQLYVWTVDRERSIHRAIASGVDGIITNQPARALRCRDGRR